jgi:UPF0755 protein
MYDEESTRVDAFGDEVSRMLRNRASQHPDHADPIGVTRRDLQTARARRQIMAGTTASLAVAGVAAVAVLGAQSAPVPVKPAVATTAPVTAQIIVESHEWSKDVIASLVASRKWKQADFDAAISGNTIGLPVWSVDSVNHQFTVEGMLEPGVYSITSADTPQSVLTRMVAQRKAYLASIGFEAKAAALTCGSDRGPCTPEQVLTIASIAEAEVIDPADGSRVAEAVHLRLAENDYLRIDTTALYYLGHLPSGQLPTLRQVADPGNPYSTYAHRGLPPTPINVPSDDMIKAALTPSVQGVYYWCVTGTGTEFFKRGQESAFDNACTVSSKTP